MYVIICQKVLWSVWSTIIVVQFELSDAEIKFWRFFYKLCQRCAPVVAPSQCWPPVPASSPPPSRQQSDHPFQVSSSPPLSVQASLSEQLLWLSQPLTCFSSDDWTSPRLFRVSRSDSNSSGIILSISTPWCQIVKQQLDYFAKFEQSHAMVAWVR